MTDANDNNTKEKWYPGKYLTKAVKKKGSVSEVSQSKRIERTEHAQKTVNDDSPFSSDILQSDNRKTFGEVHVSMVDSKFVDMKQEKVWIQLNEKCSTEISKCPCAPESFQRSLPLYDIASDVIIVVSGKNNATGADLTGVVVVPVIKLIGISGEPILPKEQWYQLFPTIESRFKVGKHYKFVSGYADLPGSAMNRGKVGLGFVKLSVEVRLDVNAYSLYTQPTATRLTDQPERSVVSSDSVDFDNTKPLPSSLTELGAVGARDIARIQAQLRLPSLLAPFLSYPEVLVVITIMAYACLYLKIWHLPITVFTLTFLNGLYTMTQRSFSHTIIWNDANSLSTLDNHHQDSSEQILNKAAFAAHMQSFVDIVGYASYVAETMEVWTNALSFGDARASVVVYTSLFGLSVVVSILCAIQIRLCVFAIGSGTVLIAAVAVVIVSAIESKANDSASYGHSTMCTIYYGAKCVRGFIGRLPDDQELIHRYICSTAIVNEKGPEMSEAAIAAGLNGSTSN